MHILPGFHLADAQGVRRTAEAAPLNSPTVASLADGFQYSLNLEAVAATPKPTAAPSAPLLTGLKENVAAYLKAESVEEVVAKGKLLPEMAKAIISTDVAEVIGRDGQSVKDNFMLPDSENCDAIPQFANTLLQELSKKVLAHVQGGKYQGLDAERLSLEKKKSSRAQHVGYMADAASRLEGLKSRPNQEMCRILLRSYFDGELKSTDGKPIEARALLASEMSKLCEDGSKLKDWVLDPANDSSFSQAGTNQPPSLLANLSAHHAGEATLEFAAKLVGGEEKKAAALIKSVFSRPEADLQQLLKDPQGKPGLLLHFAATSQHLAWEFSKLGSGYVDASEGKASGPEKWNHKNIGPTRRLLAEDATAARKVGAQINSFLLREGKLVPLERDGNVGELPLSRLLDLVERQGIFADGKDGPRVLSPFAAKVGQCMHAEVQRAATLSDWKAGGELAADLVANCCASFAAQATGADYEKKEGLVTLYRDALKRFGPQVDALLAHGIPSKQDEAYQAFYGDLAGEFSFEALKDHLGVAQAKELVREARIHHVVPQVCKLLNLPQREDYTATHVVEDIQELQKTLLKDDYFLSKPGFLDELKAEAQETPNAIRPEDLENGIRVPNAVWMWTQLMRGLVEQKPSRYTGGGADFSSDKFPSQLQLNPPDTRDVELFAWARHRLREADYEPARATRMAMSLVVLTQHKDLLQLRKSA